MIPTLFMDGLKVASGTFRGNRLRTALTALSIAIGAGAISLLVSLSRSATETIKAGIEEVGGRHILFLFDREGFGAKTVLYDKGITSEDANALRSRLLGIEKVSFFTSIPNQWLQGSNQKVAIDLAIGKAAVEFNGQELVAGRHLPDDEEENPGRVLLVCDKLANRLFGSPEAALDQSVLLWNHNYRIIGVTRTKPNASFDLGIDKSRAVFAPPRTMIKDEGVPDRGLVIVRADGSVSHEHLLRLIHAILLKRHRGAEDFEIMDFERFMDKFDTIFLGLSVITGLIAALSLFIGGIGIMNVLLASIKQRIKEIGLRRAIGASSLDIRSQFLIESGLLGVLGGLAGSSVGLFLAWAVGFVLKRTLPIPWETSLSFNAAWIAVAVSALAGVIFGLQPARRAGRLYIVACLRGEV